MNHHVTLLSGKNVKGGVIGGLRSVGGDFGALPINSNTGAGTNKGDIPLNESLESAAKTIAAAAGLPAADVNKRIKRTVDGNDLDVGKIIKAAVNV